MEEGRAWRPPAQAAQLPGSAVSLPGSIGPAACFAANSPAPRPAEDQSNSMVRRFQPPSPRSLPVACGVACAAVAALACADLVGQPEPV